MRDFTYVDEVAITKKVVEYNNGGKIFNVELGSSIEVSYLVTILSNFGGSNSN